MDGNEEVGEIIVKQTIFDVILTVGLSLFSELAKPILSLTLKNKLVKALGADVVEELGGKLGENDGLSRIYQRDYFVRIVMLW
ncbi:MAG: hypothetical protein UE033_04990 [Coprococcus sp.]|jgi:hypothetical protein|nr:hypothetical protein [Coprococcus sp.]